MIWRPLRQTLRRFVPRPYRERITADKRLRCCARSNCLRQLLLSASRKQNYETILLQSASGFCSKKVLTSSSRHHHRRFISSSPLASLRRSGFRRAENKGNSTAFCPALPVRGQHKGTPHNFVDLIKIISYHYK